MIKLKDLLKEESWEKELYSDWEKRFTVGVGNRNFTLGVKKLLTRFFYTNPKFTTQHSPDSPKNYKRTKNNKFTFNGYEYSKDEVLTLLKKYQEQGLTDVDKDDEESIVYYFDKWPKKGSEIELTKNDNTAHFVNVDNTGKQKILQKWKNAKPVDYQGLLIWEWEENGKTRAITHSLDDTWFLMTKVNGEDKFKIDDVLYEL
jgi:hypothetical protein